MQWRMLFATSLMVGAFVVDTTTAQGQIINLDATLVNSANPSGSNNVNVLLGPGTYWVKVVGLAGAGLFDAWSAWPANLGCDVNGENCERGFENQFELQFGSTHISAWDGKRYATAVQAFNNAVGATFTLTTTEFVHFGLNDCTGCLGDNRGGNSLEITTPEPAAWMLMASGLVGVLGFGWRRRYNAA